MKKCEKPKKEQLTEGEARFLASIIRVEAQCDGWRIERQERLPCPEDLDALLY